MTKIRRLLPAIMAAPLLAACAAPYPPGGGPYLANVPYYPPPAQFVPRPEPYPGRLVPPPRWVAPAPPSYREPDNPPPENPPAPPAPEPAPSEPKPVVSEAPPEPTPELHPVDPSCKGWWRLCHLWSGS